MRRRLNSGWRGSSSSSRCRCRRGIGVMSLGAEVGRFHEWFVRTEEFR